MQSNTENTHTYKYTTVDGKTIKVAVSIIKNIIRGFTAQMNSCTPLLIKTVLLQVRTLGRSFLSR